MIKFNLLKFCLFGVFIIKLCVEFSLIIFGIAKKNCSVKTREMFNFLPLINDSVTIGSQLMFYVFYLDCIV